MHVYLKPIKQAFLAQYSLRCTVLDHNSTHKCVPSTWVINYTVNKECKGINTGQHV